MTWADHSTTSVWHLRPHVVIVARQVHTGWRVRVFHEVLPDLFPDRDAAKAAAEARARELVAQMMEALGG